MDLSEIIKAIRALPEAGEMSVVTGGLDLLVRLRVRDHAHLRELLLTGIFQINGVQRTETFLSLADIDADDFTAEMLGLMRERRRAARGLRARAAAERPTADHPSGQHDVPRRPGWPECPRSPAGPSRRPFPPVLVMSPRLCLMTQG